MITAVDGTSIGDSDDLYRALDAQTIGKQVEVEVLREKKRRKLLLTLSDISS